MIASLILSNMSTAGIMSAGAVQSLGVERKLNLDKMVKGSIFGGKLVLKGLNKLIGKGGLTGINLSLSSILRQSQIFTTTVGVFFQLLGAFLDIALAPLMPGIMKGLAKMASLLPGYFSRMQSLYDDMVSKWGWAKGKIESLKTFIDRLIHPWKYATGQGHFKGIMEDAMHSAGDVGMQDVTELVFDAVTFPGADIIAEKIDEKIGAMLMRPNEGVDEKIGAMLVDPTSVIDTLAPTGNTLTGAMLMRPEFSAARNALSGAMLMRPNEGVGGSVNGASGAMLATFFANEGNQEAAQKMYSNEATQQRMDGKVQTSQRVASLHGQALSGAMVVNQPKPARTNIISRYF